MLLALVRNRLAYTVSGLGSTVPIIRCTVLTTRHSSLPFSPEKLANNNPIGQYTLYDTIKKMH